MTERMRDFALFVTVVALLGAGIAFDGLSRDARLPTTEVSAPGFYERAQFCPPRVLKDDSTARIAVATASEEPVPVGLTPLEESSVELSAGTTATRRVLGRSPVQAEGFGAPVAAAAQHAVDTRIRRAGAIEGSGGANCATDASTNWYFPAGDSAIHSDYRLVVANPFPDEAVVSASFSTPEGEEPSAQLSEVAVPSGEVEVLAISRSALPQDLLSVRLRSLRGRVVAWKAMWTRPDNEPPGYEFTLGARSARTEWFFPIGEVGGDSRQTITLMNPSDEESSVSIALASDEQPLQSSKLIEIPVPGRSSKELQVSERLDDKQRNAGEISALVSVENDVPIVAESSLILDSDELRGRMTELGATRPSRSWLVAPPVSRASEDIVAVQNVTTRDIELDIAIYGPEGRATPESLQDIMVPGGLRVSIPIRAFTSGAPHFVAVTASAEVVVARMASDDGRSDIAEIMGQPDFGRSPIRTHN